MPVARYFLFVGAALLALLFALDAFVPQQVTAVASNSAASIDKTVVRIRSDQKPPERVVYDMSLPTIVPPVVKTQIAAAPVAPVADPSAEARVRNTFAQFVPAEAKKLDKQTEPQVQTPRKRKIAKARPAQQPVRLAQQQHFGLFGNNTW